MVDGLPPFDAIDAVEIYNHGLTTGPGVDRANGAYMLDGLLERGRKLKVTAGDDSHFMTFADRFGGWVEVYATALDPAALLEGLQAGTYYSTQGPRIDLLVVDGHDLQVSTSPAYCIGIGSGGDRWLDATEHRAEAGALVTEATFDLSPFRGSYCRVTVISADGRRAWSNPIWP